MRRCEMMSLRYRTPVLAALAVLAVIFGLARTAWAAVEVRNVRLGVTAERTRLVLDLNGPVPFTLFSLPDPNRVVIDLPELSWKAPPKRRLRGGLIENLRFGLFKPGTFRLVLDVKGSIRVRRAFVLPAADGKSDRLVIDLVRASRAVFLEESRRSMQAYAARQAAEAAQRPPPTPVAPSGPRNGRRIIAIDAGHGGVDPGAIGAGGVYEKNLTLAAARAVKKALEKTGRYRVVLTRDRDVFLRLRQRVAVARDSGASLFISLHADSLENPKHRGGSVYTLSETASDKEAEALAQKENKADIIAGVDLSVESSVVQSILIDLAQRESMNLSARFASVLLRELDPVVNLQRRNHRVAGFAVLKAPDVPSVLFEMGYLSNRLDLRQLQDPAHRRRMAAAVTRAIDRFFAEQIALDPR